MTTPVHHHIINLDHAHDPAQDDTPLIDANDTEVEQEPTFSFMGLPEDVRLCVYDFLLSPADVYVRWHTRSVAYDMRFIPVTEDNKLRPPKAETQLLQVCKTIKKEALDLYLTNNIFNVFGTDTEAPFVATAGGPKKLSIVFDRRSLDISTSMDSLNNYYADSMRKKYPEWTDLDWRSKVHDELTEEMLATRWEGLVDTVCSLQLEFLEVNLQHCTCPCGCRNLIGEALRMLCTWEAGAAPRMIIFLGTRSKEEHDLCKAMVEEVDRETKVVFAGIYLEVDKSLHCAVWSRVDELHVDKEGDVVADSAA